MSKGKTFKEAFNVKKRWKSFKSRSCNKNVDLCGSKFLQVKSNVSRTLNYDKIYTQKNMAEPPLPHLDFDAEGEPSTFSSRSQHHDNAICQKTGVPRRQGKQVLPSKRQISDVGSGDHKPKQKKSF